MPKIYTIIVTYNAMQRNWIDRCLMSLQKSTVPTIPVLIDNGSIDGTREHIPTHYPDVVWLPQDRNLGFGQANNIGIRYALEHQADYVLLLNQDAAIDADTIFKMLEVSDGYSLISPVHLNGDGGQLFFHYSEDNNYYHRMVYYNIKTVLVPKAFMYHDRTLYGNAQMYHRGLLHRDIVLIACNINISFIQCIFEWMKVVFKCYMTWLPKRHYIPGTFLYEMLWLITHGLTICKSRKKEKTIGRNWL